MLESLGKVKGYLQLVPTIIEVVTVIERTVPLPGQGKAKLELVLALVEQFRAEIKDVDVNSLKGTITNMINTFVGFMNAVGAFKSK